MRLPDVPVPPPDPANAASGRSFQTRIGGVEGEGEKLCPSCEARYGKDAKACPRDGTALVDIDDTVGTVLSGTYFVRRVLGEGAMGKVFEARHTRLPAKRFAIKMLHPEYVREPQLLARFAREAEAAATIDHPHVVGVVDVDRTADGRPFLVSELLEGKDFSDYLHDKGKMPAPAAVRIALQVTNALAAAHARGIIHRDVKPENIFLTGDLAAPTAKVLDFGMSRLERREGKVLTQAGAVLGTPSFMPPEQARGDRVDHRVDVYAVGAILYTALTGQRPFDRETPAATLLAVLGEEPPKPRSIEPSIPEALERVILRAMAREPDDRYATMAELAAALACCDTAPDAPASNAASSGPGRTLPDRPDDPLLPHARPALAALLAAAFAWAAAVLSSALATIVRALHAEGDAVSIAETAAVIAVTVIALGPPAALAARALLQGTWRKPTQAAAILRLTAPPAIATLLVYALSAAAIRSFDATILASRAIWSGWDILLPLAAVLCGGLPVGVLVRAKQGAKI
jgi:serine/threonine-protein kinase